MIFGVFKISGHSMLPYFNPGERIIVSNIPFSFRQPKVGEVVVFNYYNKILVKRITKILDKKLFVAGDNKKDSLGIDSVESNDILGKVVFKF